jgi:hypothetical protein
MKHFVCRRHHGRLARRDRAIHFIAAIDADPELKGRITYRCMKTRDDATYFHLASAADDAAVRTLQSRAFFKAYTEKTRKVAAGDEVTGHADRIDRRDRALTAANHPPAATSANPRQSAHG